MATAPSPAAGPVLHVSTSTNNGGADRHAVSIAAGMKGQGWDVRFACSAASFTEQRCRERGVETKALTLVNSVDLRAVQTLVRLIRSERIQLLHAHARRDYVATAVAGRLTACPVVLHQHVVRPLGEPHGLAGHFFNRVQAIVAVSHHGESELHRWHSLRPDLVRCIYNGVDLARFQRIGPPRLREQWGIPRGAVTVGMVGRLTTKGQAALLEQIPRLLALFPESYFVFVGPGDHTVSQEAFQQRVEARGLGNRVRVTGVYEDIPAVMAALDLLVHLPSEEAFGLVLVEAALAGVPAIATRVGGCTEVVEDGRTGFLVPPGDTAVLTDRLRTLLCDTGLRRRFGTAARARARTRFSEEQQLTALSQLYRELIG